MRNGRKTETDLAEAKRGRRKTPLNGKPSQDDQDNLAKQRAHIAKMERYLKECYEKFQQDLEKSSVREIQEGGNTGDSAQITAKFSKRRPSRIQAEISPEFKRQIQGAHGDSQASPIKSIESKASTVGASSKFKPSGIQMVNSESSSVFLPEIQGADGDSGDSTIIRFEANTNARSLMSELDIQKENSEKCLEAEYEPQVPGEGEERGDCTNKSIEGNAIVTRKYSMEEKTEGGVGLDSDDSVIKSIETKVPEKRSKPRGSRVHKEEQKKQKRKSSTTTATPKNIKAEPEVVVLYDSSRDGMKKINDQYVILPSSGYSRKRCLKLEEEQRVRADLETLLESGPHFSRLSRFLAGKLRELDTERVQIISDMMKKPRLY